ncbi:MAG: hypothetical protein J5829_06610 [Lachnospiraceae bacterium]|nr:hypothetical protein [Lachnospiraceae bacterium]
MIISLSACVSEPGKLGVSSLPGSLSDPVKDVTENTINDTSSASSSLSSSEVKQKEIHENEAVWAVYWDEEDVIRKLADRSFDTDIVCIFEAYFNDGYDLVFNDNAAALFEKIKTQPECSEKKFFLTVVNDVVGSGETVQKDTKVLYSVLSDPKKHAEDVVRLAKKNGFDGIEIDYEKIRNDIDLWDLFISFEKELIALCDREGLEVRVVLEPSTPVSKIDLPEGAEYVVMCYNLFGYGTKPGPKADEEFIFELASEFESLPGDTGYALANGGFDWDLTADKITALTDLEAKELVSGHEDAMQDPSSGVLHFTYEKDGHKHEVWAADDSTIEFWRRILKDKTGRDVKISLWRL